MLTTCLCDFNMPQCWQAILLPMLLDSPLHPARVVFSPFRLAQFRRSARLKVAGSRPNMLYAIQQLAVQKDRVGARGGLFVPTANSESRLPPYF
jgi:hypothetical protein